ncbi:MAG: FtsX-like permease family protein [Actinoplanes sp.]
MSVLRTQLAGVARRPSRLLLTGLAVLVVSFVVYATVLAQRITERSLLDGLSGTPAAVDLVVSNGEINTGQLDAVRKVDGVAEAVGRTDIGGAVGSNYLQLTADPGVGPLSVASLTSGRYPTKPGEIAVTPRTVERMGLKVGTVFQMVVRYDPKGEPLPASTFRVVGLVDVRDDFGFQAYAPQAAISAAAGSTALTQIDLRLRAGADAGAVQAAVQKLITGETTTATGNEVRHAEAEAKTSEVNSVFAVIAMFVAIAVVAAGLVATSTFRIVFAQRMRQLALLRAIGAGRGPITRALAVEGMLIGLVTGLAGVLLALGAGQLAPPLLKLFDQEIAGPGVPFWPAVATVLLAVVITTVAVIAPAASASRVSPLEALRSSGTTGSRADIGKLRWAAGLLFAVGAGLVAAYVVRNLPGRDPKDYDPMPMLLGVVASGALAFFALVALGPVLVRPVLALLGWPVRRSGSVGRLAAGGVGGAPRRAAAVSVVVALGVTLIAGVLVGGASIRSVAEREAAASAPADYELTAIEEDRIPATMIGQLVARKELTHVTGYRRLEVKVGTTELSATDLAVGALPELAKVDVAAGRLADLGPGRVVLSGYVRDDTGATVGDEVTVANGSSSVRLKVAAVLPASAPLGSSVLLDPADLTRLGAPVTFNGLLADASGDGEQARSDGLKAIDEVQAAAGGKWKIEVLADQRDQIDDALNLVLSIALALIGLTVLIAVVGVGTTTALSVVERVRESGLLRAIGLSRGGLRTMLTTESALYGVIGAGIGLALGVPYAWLAVKALGLNAPLTVPVWQLALVFVVLVALTALAGVVPARRAARVSPVVALGAE